MLAVFRERIRNGFGRHADDLWGVSLLVGGILIGLAFFGLAGPVGDAVTRAFELLFGVWGYVAAGVLVVLGAMLLVTVAATITGAWSPVSW
ncbi:MAG: hypothetical protein A2146_03065 [Actinobacteria bacterium RBG_16_67_10]|nr:MAG: hypothetical protein A2146_03065 [Actinobacteria bacterium RBG_16_67_10]